MITIESIIQDLKKQSKFNLLIYINLGVFITIKLIYVSLFLFNVETINIIAYLAVPSYLKTLIHRPWTVITYMFSHESFMHLLFNLLVFYWFGKLFIQYLTQRQLLGVYILGGFAGAFLYILAYNLIPVFEVHKYSSMALGASASIMAIVLAVATLVPKLNVHLLFFGRVKLKYLAIAIVLIDVISIPISNAGGHIAHLGGALLGVCFVKLYRDGTDISVVISRPISWIKRLFSNNKDMKISYKNQTKRSETDIEYNTRKKENQDKVDKILDKIAKSGYSSLNKTEKETLFKMSNRK